MITYPQSKDATVPSYLVWAILTTCFCCQPTGIYSIILSCKVNSLVAQNKIEEAKQTSAKAKKWIFISVGAWLVSAFLYFLLTSFL